MNFKQFSTSDNQWHDVPYYQHKTATDTLTLPAVIYPNDTSITVGIKGNTTQSGTPSPDSPITPSETGDKTANLYTSEITDCTINSGGRLISAENSTVLIAPIVQGETYSIDKKTLFAYFSNMPAKGDYAYDYTRNFDDTFTVPITGYVAVKHLPTDINQMMNEGSTVLPYEPYGYKIPILNNSQTTNVYLGEVQSTRRIEKLVLTGTETFGYADSCLTLSFDGQSSSLQPVKTIIICDRYLGGEPKYRDQLHNYQCCITRNYNQIAIRDNNYADTDAWKTYLQQQYTNGTPVTIWYVLAEPTTGVVNEPLMKIGDYADEVSGITIPTIAGTNTISVGTTLQPSEVTATYKGWHPVTDVHERENGQWD